MNKRFWILPVLASSLLYGPLSCGGSDALSELTGHSSDLSLAGAIQGAVRSEGSCTKYTDYLKGVWTENINNKIYLLEIIPTRYTGPGNYITGVTEGAPVITLTDQSGGNSWSSKNTSQPGTIVVDSDQHSGSIDALLTSSDTSKSTIRVTGEWGCKASNY